MNEHSFIRSVHRKLPRSTYAWKINDAFQGGVADAYYSDTGGDLWVEYKYLKALPKRPTTAIRIDLSDLQKLWLEARHGEGRRVAVVVGSPQGAVILHGVTWKETLSCANFIRCAVAVPEVATYITQQVARRETT